MLLSHQDALHALNEGHVLLVSRCAFSSEEELRKSYPPTGDEELWAEKAKPWYQKRRHLYVICINPDKSSQYITSSAEPDKTTDPWTLQFCSENAPITCLDINALLLEEQWNQYNVAVILLSKEDYPSHKVTSIIQSFRLNPERLTYSIDEKHGYDCQTATRDILQSANPDIDANNLTLPPLDILAYKSSLSLCSHAKTVVLGQFSGENKTEYYRQKNLQNWRKIETYSLFNSINKTSGSLIGKSICDLGCGNGFYSRKCLEQGAEIIEGFDLSPDMIHEATQQIRDPQKEKYTLSNVLELDAINRLKTAFDIVLVIYLWNYAKNPIELRRFMEIAFFLLRAGGVVYVVTDNKTNICDYASYQRYGMFREPSIIPPEQDNDGLEVDYIFGQSKELGHRLTNYRMTKESIERAAQEVGFYTSWHTLDLPLEFQDDQESWATFLNEPPITIYSLNKPT